MTEDNFKKDSETVSSGDTPVSKVASPQKDLQTEIAADVLSGDEAGAERVPGDEGRSVSADNAAPAENPGTVTPESFGEVVEVIHTAAGNVVTVGRKLSREMGLLLGSGLLTEEAKQQCTKICLDNASKYKSAVPETDIDKSYLDYKEEYVTIKLPVSVSKEHYFWVTYKSDATEDRIIVKHIFRLNRNDSVHPEKPSVSATDPAHAQPDIGKVAGTEPPAAIPVPEDSSQPQDSDPACRSAAAAVSDKNAEAQSSVIKTIDPPEKHSDNETVTPSESLAAPTGEPDSVQLKTGTEIRPELNQEPKGETPHPVNSPRVDDAHKSPAANNAPDTGVKPAPVQPAPKPRPNPRDLWKDIKTNTDIPYYKDDTATAFCIAENGKVKIFGASRRGRSHAHVGAPRDDDFQIKTDDITGWIYLVVADGAGSAKYSRMGAKLACEVVAQKLPDLIKNEKFQEALTRLESNPGFGEVELEQLRKSAYYVLPKAAHEAFKSLNELVSTTKEKSELRDFATTLLCVITRKIHDRQLIISFAIGDGAIAVYDAGNSANTHLMNTPDSGEFAGQTRFLTMKSIFANSQEIMARIRILCVPDYTAIMLMTDGVSDAKFETESLLEDKARWDDFWRDLTETGSDDSPPLKLDSSAKELSEQLLAWLNFWVVGNHDDRTIVVMCKGGAE